MRDECNKRHLICTQQRNIGFYKFKNSNQCVCSCPNVRRIFSWTIPFENFTMISSAFWIEQDNVSRLVLHEALNWNVISNAGCSSRQGSRCAWSSTKFSNGESTPELINWSVARLFYVTCKVLSDAMRIKPLLFANQHLCRPNCAIWWINTWVRIITLTWVDKSTGHSAVSRYT